MNLRAAICTALSLTMAAMPMAGARAQANPQPSHAACIDFSSVPDGETVFFRFKDDANWRPAPSANRALLLAASRPESVRLLVWRTTPRHEGERTLANTREYVVELRPASQPASCGTASADYRVMEASDGYALYIGPRENPTHDRSGSPSAGTVAAVVIGAVLLAAIFSRAAARSDGNNHSSQRDAARQDAALQAERWNQQERARREAADRAAQERQAAAAYERLQRPNALGW